MSPAGAPSAALADELAVDLAALRAGAALVERDADLVEISGPDRLRLLQGLVTADVKSLPAGAAARGFFTTGQGKILADFRLLALPESAWLILPTGTGEPIRAHLEKYKVASRVKIERVVDRRLYELCGPRAGEVAALGQFAGDGGAGLVASAEGGASFHVLKASAAAMALAEWLREGAASGLRKVSAAAVEVARIEDGELLFGVDFTGENFPQETGREGDISYSKGCYLGQEVVARIHYRGGVQRLPRGLRFAEAGVPAAAAELLLEGRAVGRATSITQSPRWGGIGLGLVHQRGSGPGTRLDLAGGGTAEVVELPFRSPQRKEAG